MVLEIPQEKAPSHLEIEGLNPRLEACSSSALLHSRRSRAHNPDQAFMKEWSLIEQGLELSDPTRSFKLPGNNPDLLREQDSMLHAQRDERHSAFHNTGTFQLLRKLSPYNRRHLPLGITV